MSAIRGPDGFLRFVGCVTVGPVRSQQGGQIVEGAVDALGDCGVDHPTSVEVGGGGEHGGGGRVGVKENEKRPQHMVDHEHVPGASARGHEQHGLAVEGPLPDDVHEMLEHPRIRPSVGGDGDDEQVGVLHGLEGLLGGGVDVGARHGRGESGPQMVDVHSRDVGVVVPTA